MGPATYLTYRENQRVFEGIGAWDPTEVSITGGGDPERVQALLVSAATLPLLRVQPVVGRLFSAEDDTRWQSAARGLTYGYWQRRFGGAENIVGQTARDRWQAGRSHRRAALVVQVPAHPPRHSCCRCRWTRTRRAASASAFRRSRG